MCLCCSLERERIAHRRAPSNIVVTGLLKDCVRGQLLCGEDKTSSMRNPSHTANSSTDPSTLLSWLWHAGAISARYLEVVKIRWSVCFTCCLRQPVQESTASPRTHWHIHEEMSNTTPHASILHCSFAALPARPSLCISQLVARPKCGRQSSNELCCLSEAVHQTSHCTLSVTGGKKRHQYQLSGRVFSGYPPNFGPSPLLRKIRESQKRDLKWEGEQNVTTLYDLPLQCLIIGNKSQQLPTDLPRHCLYLHAREAVIERHKKNVTTIPAVLTYCTTTCENLLADRNLSSTGLESGRLPPDPSPSTGYIF